MENSLPAAHGLSSTRATISGMTSPARITGHRVADPDILLPDLIFVMEGGAADRDAADTDRLEDGYRGQDAGAADIAEDIEHLGGGASGGEFIGDGPAWVPLAESQLVPPGQTVHLDNHAIDLEAESVPPFCKLGVVGKRRVNIAYLPVQPPVDR